MRTEPIGRMWRVAVALGVTVCLVGTSSCTSGGGSAEPATSTSAATAGRVLRRRQRHRLSGAGRREARPGGGQRVLTGETTASFLDVTAQSNGCDNSLQSGSGYRTSYPLHVRYDAPDQSQLDFGVRTLTEAAGAVDLVTVQIGANDDFLCRQTTANRCSTPGDVAALTQSVQANLQKILSTLRTQGRYDGQIVVVTYYALNYADAVRGRDAGTGQRDRADGGSQPGPTSRTATRRSSSRRTGPAGTRSTR